MAEGKLRIERNRFFQQTPRLASLKQTQLRQSFRVEACCLVSCGQRGSCSGRRSSCSLHSECAAQPASSARNQVKKFRLCASLENGGQSLSASGILQMK